MVVERHPIELPDWRKRCIIFTPDKNRFLSSNAKRLRPRRYGLPTWVILFHNSPSYCGTAGTLDAFLNVDISIVKAVSTMKRFVIRRKVPIVLTILAFCVILWSSSYSSAVADVPLQPEQTQVIPEETQVVLDAPVAANATTRASMPLNQVLLGHWMTNSGETHAYFSATKIILINQLRGREQLPLSHKQAMVYEVASTNEQANVLNLKVQTRFGWAQTRMLRFASDRQTFTESTNVLGHAINSRWTYVDDQRQPA
jgi:hypothetical protein